MKGLGVKGRRVRRKRNVKTGLLEGDERILARTSFALDPSVLLRLKVEAANRNTTMVAMIEDWVKGWRIGA